MTLAAIWACFVGVHRAAIALAYYGLDRVTFELENPLGWDDNDIDLTAIMHALADETMKMHESVFGPDPPPPPPPALSLLVANLEKSGMRKAIAQKKAARA
ncbi:bestrophin family ion channel [Silvimonas sp.]|uniref:bestrophin family ion channel n=1 Tax=Silvimonas sp. TaxID=2650811 RepID=UPI00283B2192|nr:bestrophin family ion channel [Silvimonas sp.]MDR3427818.1 bestrophin family ion channel [Silvimonas sp.]